MDAFALLDNLLNEHISSPRTSDEEPLDDSAPLNYERHGPGNSHSFCVVAWYMLELDSHYQESYQSTRYLLKCSY